MVFDIKTEDSEAWCKRNITINYENPDVASVLGSFTVMGALE